MDFMTAVRTCLTKYVDFSGRARRREFWFFVLFTFLLGIVASILDLLLGTESFNNDTGLVNTLVGLALLLPTIAVVARRLHDIGRSGWWQVVGLAAVPAVFISPLLSALVVLGSVILLLVCVCLDGQPGDNRFGPNPKTGPTGGPMGGYPPPPAYGGGQYGGGQYGG